jgi:DnaK suppressor protein
MSTPDHSSARARLLALRDELLQSRRDSAEDVKPVALDQAAVGRVSRVDALQMQHMALETARRREQRLTLISGALGRIESGDYGFCVDCDEAIDERRLSADPTALRCIRCAEKKEK